MKNIFKKRIVDERMELQSLRNARKSGNFFILATGLSVLAELYLFQWELKYVAPQAVLVFAAGIYNIFLDTRDGNIYTAEASNRLRVLLLYALTAFVTALMIGYHYCTKFTITAGIISFLLSFFLMFGLMYLLDTIVFRIGQKRALKHSEEED